MADQIPDSVKSDDFALLPCPFCRGEAQLVISVDGDYVECGSCLATMPPHDPDVPSEFDRWNTRAAPPAMDREAAIEECAQIADNHVAMGYMSGRERDYCHEHGDEIAAKIRALSTLSADAIRQGEGWRLVPTVMTPEMIEAWRSAPGLDCQAAYTAMLAATPASHASDGGK